VSAAVSVEKWPTSSFEVACLVLVIGIIVGPLSYWFCGAMVVEHQGGTLPRLTATLGLWSALAVVIDALTLRKRTDSNAD
jgi:hypothetical protein